MKKYRICSLLLILFVPLMVVLKVNAREMSLKELGELVNQDADTIYIVGNYAFSSEHVLTTQDIMIASRTISLTAESKKHQFNENIENDEVYKKMTIHKIDITKNDDFEIESLKVVDNLFGDTKLDLDYNDESKKYNIDYIDYKYYAKVSQATIKFEESVIKNEEKYTTYLKNGFNFNKDTKLYSDTLNYDSKTGKLTGLMLYFNLTKGFGEDDKTGYYLPFVIEVPGLTNDTTVKIEEDKTTNATYSNFDVKAQEEGKTPGMMVVWSIPGKNGNKKITITIDLDGPNKDEYGDTVYTIDYSDLEFQGESKAKDINMTGASETDKKTLKEDWGYDSTKNKGVNGEGQLTLVAEEGQTSTYKLKGTLVEQKLNDNVYGADKADGYYFDFTILLDNNTSKTAVVKAKTGTSGNEKAFKKEEFDDQGNLTILQRIGKDSECATNSKSNNENCKIIITIDLDGDGDKYFPSTYTIDFSEVKFEKSSLVEMLSVSVENMNESNWNGFKEGDHYSTTFDTNGNVVKVSGFITIFDDTKWSSKNPFELGAFDYYLAFKLKKADTKGNKVNDIVKFLTEGSGDGEQNKITNVDFGENDEIYVLKYIDPFKSGTTKKFTIEVDLDGDEGKDYAPYVLTVDWSELDFQIDSSHGSDYDTVNPSQIDEQDKNELETTYGFNFELDSIRFNTTAEGDGTQRNGLTGTIKEQKLSQAAGFGDEGGYYVPVKITIPEELVESCKGKWTIYLKNGNGDYVEKKRPENHYEDGYIVVLFKMNDRSQDIHYKIDYDGSDNYEYIISDEMTIKTEFTYLSENEVTFEYFDEKTGKTISDKKIIYEGEKFSSEIVPQFTDTDYSFHKFDYWYKKGTGGETQYNIDTETTKENEDITLKAHWTIDVDKFLGEVIADLGNGKTNFSEDFSSHFDVTKTDTTITFNVKNTTTKLSELSNTSIPGTIAYLLQRGEIKDITLFSGGKKIVFTKDGVKDGVQSVPISLDAEGLSLKEQVQVGAKSLFADLLESEGGEETYTLNKMATTNKTFTLSVGEVDESVTLSDVGKKSYEFKFVSEIKTVSNKEDLVSALSAGDTKVIYIEDSFNVDGTVEITKQVDINGSDGKTISASSGEGPIFKVKSTGVKIENVGLKAGTETTSLIRVEDNGNLTASNLTITPAESANKLEAAFDVKSGTLTVSGLTYDSEHYTRPAVRAAKSGVTVKLTGTDEKQASAKEKENITTNDSSSDTKSKDNTYDYVNYYNKPENSIIYKTELYNYQAGARLSYIKYNYYNEKVNIPTDSQNGKINNFTYNGENYELFAFSESSFNVLRGSNSLLGTDIAKDNLKATKYDAHYWAVYKVSLEQGVTKVNTADEFIKDLKDTNIHEIYVSAEDNNNELVIDYTENDGVLKIDRDLSIIGPSTLSVKIKAKKIEISENVKKVLFNRVAFEIQAGANQEALIEVNGEKLSFWQSSLTNTGSAVDYAIKYNNETSSVVDVRYVGTSNSKFSGNNINKGYIYVVGKMAEGSTLISNAFPEIKDKTTSAIIINDFNENAVLKDEEDGEPDIRFENNSVKTPYAIVFTKNTSGKKADIKLGNSKIKVGVEYAEGKKDFGGIGLYANPSNITFTYLDGDKNLEEHAEKPDGVTKITIKAVTTPVVSVSNTANITGLTKNEDGTFSGTIAQSSNGDFYLPVVLSSSNFDNEVSRVTVTDPNGEKQEYLYSENSENGFTPVKTVSGMNTLSTGKNVAGTMKLNLEALKTSKIKDGNKQYNITIDYDGNIVADEAFVIDYNDVRTEEEIILEAAKKTQAAQSFTVTKDNNIKGGIDKYTYKVDKKNNTRLYEGTVSGKAVKQYTFKVENKDLFYVVEQSENIDKQVGNAGPRPKLNNWTYFSSFNTVANGIVELELLKDFTNKEEKFTDAIAKVTKDEGSTNTYTVKINKERLESWLNATFIDSHVEETTEENTKDYGSNEASVTLKVTLDSKNEYVTKIETPTSFTITKGSTEYKDNNINVTIKDVNSTTVEGPQKMLGTGEQDATDEQIQEFINKGVEWWHKHTGSSGA